MESFDFNEEKFETHVPFHNYFLKRKAHVINRIVENKELNCLDIGCGSGEMEKLIYRDFKKITGIDTSKDRIKEANSIRLFNCEFKTNVGTEVDFKDNSFDIVLMINVLHHVDYRDRTKLLKEVKRVLKYKGISLIFEHNPFNPLVWYRFYYVSKIDKRCQMVNPLKLKRKLNELGFKSKLRFMYSEGFGEYYIHARI